jgi:hypothetical protein
MFALAVIVPLEYTFVALSSLVSKVVVANFIRDLGETSRSRETKSECQAMEKKIVSRYRQSLLWPVEVWKGFQRKK